MYFMNFYNLKSKWVNGYLLIACLVLLLPLVGKSQSATVNGQVADQEGNALSGVSVFSKGTNRGTTTADNGEFSIQAAASDTLTFSFIGYDPQEIAVAGQQSISVVLIPNNEQLSEVVVIGYGQQRKGDLTSSVATVNAENFVKAPVQDAGQLLQ